MQPTSHTRRLLLLAAGLCLAPLGHAAETTAELPPDMVYTAEDGSKKTKAQLLDELRPLPKEIWGKLKVTGFVERRETWDIEWQRLAPVQEEVGCSEPAI